MNKVKIFLSSAMNGELDVERELLRYHFNHDSILKHFYDLYAIEEHASSRKIDQAFTEEVIDADIIIFLFNESLRKPVLEEYETAKNSNKKIIAYLKKSSTRDSDLESFIKSEIYTYNPGSYYEPNLLCEQMREDLSDDLMRTYNREIRSLANNQILELTKINVTSPRSIYRFFPVDTILDVSKQKEISKLSVDQLIALSAYISDDEGNYKSALVLLEIALLYEPDNWILHNNRGLLLDTMGVYDGAIFSFKKATEINDASDAAYYNLGNAHFKFSEYHNASLNYLKSLELNPEKETAITQLAATYIKMNFKDEALKWAKKAHSLSQNKITITNLISALALNDHTEQAMALLEGMKDNQILKSKLEAFVLYKSSMYEKSIQIIDSLNEKGAMEYDTSSTKFYCLIELSEEATAYEWFKYFEKIFPITAWSYNDFGYAFINKFGKSKYCSELFIKALEIDKNLMISWNNLQYNYFHLGEFEKSLKACEGALEINPFDSNSIRNKSLCLAELGSFSKMIEFNIDRTVGLLGSEMADEQLKQIISESFTKAGIDKEKFDGMMKNFYELNKLMQKLKK